MRDKRHLSSNNSLTHTVYHSDYISNLSNTIQLQSHSSQNNKYNLHHQYLEDTYQYISENIPEIHNTNFINNIQHIIYTSLINPFQTLNRIIYNLFIAIYSNKYKDLQKILSSQSFIILNSYDLERHTQHPAWQGLSYRLKQNINNSR